MDVGLVREVVLRRDALPDGAAYPFSIPAVASLDRLALDPAVTFFAGENGSGKSTLLEAIAVAARLNPEGGSRNVTVSTRVSHSELHRYLRLVRGARRIRDGYFLRAESFYNVATYLEGLDGGLRPYGGVSLHARSHGESFIALVRERFGRDGFYVLDEPEAALSLRGVLALMRLMRDLTTAGAQFVVATHSPVLLGYPGALIYVFDGSGIRRARYEETEQYTLTRDFLEDRERFLRHLFE